MAETPLAEHMYEVDQIKQLKTRYCLLIDAQDWRAWRELFTDDLHVEGDGVPDGPYESADAWVAAISTYLEGYRGFHQVGAPLIELEGVSAARALFPFSSNGVARGYYDERYRKEAGKWKIASIKLTIILSETPEQRTARAGMFHTVREKWSRLTNAWGRCA